MSRYPQMAGLSQRDRSVLGRFGAFCAQEGLGPLAAVIEDQAVIEAFLALGCRSLAPHSVGTYRSVLWRLSGTASPSPGRFPASAAPRPYGPSDVAALWSMARHQPSTRRITNASVLLATMLGAGLHPGELARLMACDVQRRDAATTLVVSGARARLVPVMAPYDIALAAIADRTSGYLFRPGAAVRTAKNLIGEVCAALVHDPDEVALVSGRARATFLCAHLRARTALGELCAMAGLEGVESLLRYARHVDGAPQSKAALRRAART
jgi:integrase